MIVEMEKQNKIEKTRKLVSILDDYNDILNDCKSSQTVEIVQKIDDLQKEAKQTFENKIKSEKLDAFVILVIFIFAGVFIFLTIKENDNLHRDNIEKTNIINKLQWTDSLFNQIMNLQYDSLGNRSVTYRTVNGKIITYDALIKENDRINQEKMELKYKHNRIQYEISNLQWIDSLFRNIMPIKDDNVQFSIYRYNDGRIITYDDFAKENKMLSSEKYDLEKENKMLSSEKYDLEKANNLLKTKLDLVQKKYDITFKETDKSIKIEALKLDSALMLLPYYRDKLEYNPENKSWTITYSK
jgi:hypothetical protein